MDKRRRKGSRDAPWGRGSTGSASASLESIMLLPGPILPANWFSLYPIHQLAVVEHEPEWRVSENWQKNLWGFLAELSRIRDAVLELKKDIVPRRLFQGRTAPVSNCALGGEVTRRGLTAFVLRVEPIVPVQLLNDPGRRLDRPHMEIVCVSIFELLIEPWDMKRLPSTHDFEA